MERYFYINSNGQQVGPFKVEDLKQQGINSSTLIWCEGMSEWQPAGSVIDFTLPPPPPSHHSMPPPSLNVVSRPDNLMVWAILTTVFCCLPFGIVAIVESSRVNSEWYRGNHDAAVRAASRTRTFVIISAAFGFMVYVIWFLVSFSGLFRWIR